MLMFTLYANDSTYRVNDNANSTMRHSPRIFAENLINSEIKDYASEIRMLSRRHVSLESNFSPKNCENMLHGHVVNFFHVNYGYCK